MATAHYRLLTPTGEVTEEGSADAAVTGGTFVLTPTAGEVLAVPFGQIASVAQAEQFTLRVALARGTVVELSRMGAMRTQLLAEMKDAHANAAAKTAATVGEADIFSGLAGGEQAEIRVYDDALLIVGSANALRVSFAFVKSVRDENYVVTVEVTGSDPVMLTRLGNRTGEFTTALSRRIGDARSRTSAFLGALLPGLDPMALRQAAGLLRDGVAVPVGTLNGIHPELAATLIEVAAMPARRAGIEELTRHADLAIGFRQVSSVHKEADGVTAWQDHSASPHIGDHDGHAGSFASGFAGMLAAGVMADGPGAFGPAQYGAGFGGGGFGSGGFGLSGFGGGGYGSGGSAGYGPFGFGEGYGDYGHYWAYRALGAGMRTPEQHQMTQRPDVTRGRLIPAGDDLSALTASGDDPTVLGFVLATSRDRVVFEVLNLADPPTLVFAASGQDGVGVINRALVDSGFKPPAPAGGGLTAPPRQVGEPGRADRPLRRPGPARRELVEPARCAAGWLAEKGCVYDGAIGCGPGIGCRPGRRGRGTRRRGGLGPAVAGRAQQQAGCHVRGRHREPGGSRRRRPAVATGQAERAIPRDRRAQGGGRRGFGAAGWPVQDRPVLLDHGPVRAGRDGPAQRHPEP